MSSQWVTRNARTLLQGFCLADPLLGIRYYHTRREIPLVLSALPVVLCSQDDTCYILPSSFHTPDI